MAFTLVELMVAMTVLAVILVTSLAIVGAVSRNTGTSRQGLESALRAQQLFQRLALDMAGSVRRSDVPSAASSGSQNFLTLVSEVPAGESGDGTNFFRPGLGEPAIIIYRTATNSGSPSPALAGWPEIQRAAVGAYSGDSFGLDASANSPQSIAPSTSGGIFGNGDFDFLIGGVVKMDVSYVDENGRFLPADGTPLVNHHSLVVTIALVEDRAKSRAKPADFVAAAAALPSPASGTTSPHDQWLAAWEQGAPASVPKHVWNALRIYQHSFLLR